MDYDLHQERQNDMHAIKNIHKEALEAAREGNIDDLYCLIEKYPQLLDDLDKFKFVHSPLHEAARCGQTHFAIEVMNLMPSLGKKLNPQGLSPLDLAVLEGAGEDDDEENQSNCGKRQRKNETAKALIKLDVELIRVKGKKMMTPMHHAVIENNQELLAEFLCACPGSIDDQTSRFQNAVHLAVENKKIEIFYLLLGWLARKNREDVLCCKDEDGNNPLHIAVQRGEVQMVKELAGKVHRTVRNKEKLTALDIAEQTRNSTIKSLLLRWTDRNTDNILAIGAYPMAELMKTRMSFAEKFLRMYLNATREISLDMRNIFLVIAVLIVTAAFQGILSPPGGLWQGNGDIPPDLNASPAATSGMYKYQRKKFPSQHFVGKAVVRPDILDGFLIGNTMAFISAYAVMCFTIPFRPYSIALFFSVLCLAYSYLKAMVMVSEPSSVSRSLVCVTCVLTVCTFILRLCLFLTKSLLKDYWWLPRFSVPIINLLYQFSSNGLANSLLKLGARVKLLIIILEDRS